MVALHVAILFLLSSLERVEAFQAHASPAPPFLPRRRNTERMMKTFYAGTDDDKLLIADMDATGALSVRKAIVNAPNPYELSAGAPEGIATEWVVMHPNLPLLFAITSYWAKAHAVVVTYRILPDGDLEKQSSVSTGCYQGAQAALSPDGNFLAISHYLDGRVSIFAIKQAEGSAPSLGEEPLCIMDLPGEGRLPVEEQAAFSYRGPIGHGVTYSPDGKHIVVVNTGNCQLASYALDVKTGCPLNPEEPKITNLILPSSVTSAERIGTRMTNFMAGMGPRPRHVVFRPDGRYAYVVHEFINLITWHKVTENDDGSMDISEALGHTPSLPAEVKIGDALQGASEIACSKDGEHLFVSNRCIVAKGKFKDMGSDSDDGQSCVVAWALDEDTGAPIPSSDVKSSVVTDGVPRHFVLLDGKEIVDGDQNVEGSALSGEHKYLLLGTQDTGKMELCQRGGSSEGDGSLGLVMQTCEVGYPICCIAGPFPQTT